MPGEQVDGNDPAAVLAVLSEAVERARAGGGPPLVEAHTYRMRGRTPTPTTPPATATTPRSPPGVGRDPIARLETYLRGRGLLDDDGVAAGRRRGRGGAPPTCATRHERRRPSVDPLALFDHVYAEPPRSCGAARPARRPSWTAEADAADAPRRQRRAADGRRDLTMAKALNRALRDAMAADDVGARLRRGRRHARRRLPDHRRADRATSARTAASTPRWPSPASSASPSAWPCTACGPVVEMQFDAFAYPAFEQIASHVAKMRNRTRGARDAADGHPRPVRRRHRRSRAPLRLLRGLLRAHARA